MQSFTVFGFDIAQSTCIWLTHGFTDQAGYKQTALESVKALMVITMKYLIDTYLSLRSSSMTSCVPIGNRTLGRISNHLRLSKSIGLSMVAFTNVMGAIVDAWWQRGWPGEQDLRSKLVN